VWTHGEHVDADPRQVLPFLLTRFGQEVEERAFRGYRLVTYELPSPAINFAEPPDFVATSANFDDRLELVAEAHSPQAASGEAAWVVLRWQTQQAMDHSYKVSLRLVDAQGHLAGQADTSLLSNEHDTTADWKPGQMVTTYHRLPSLPATLPDRYGLYLTLYDPEMRSPVASVDEAGIPLGQRLALGYVEIGRPWRQSTVEPTTPLDPIRLIPALELVGYDLDRELFSPGEMIHLALYWHALEEIGQDYAVTVQLVSGVGEVTAEWRQEPVYPTSLWRANDLWRHWQNLKIAPDLASGEYQLVVKLAGVAAGEAVAATLRGIEVQGRPRLFQVPDMGHPQGAQLGEAIQFLGYDLPENPVRAGDVLRLTLYWQALQESTRSYTVFTHLLDANSCIWGQKDSLPGGGALPTTGWMVGEVLVDNYEIVVDPNTPPGKYFLEIGMYNAATDERLPASDQAGTMMGDHLILDTPVVVTH
jgi:hypothetical protein